MNVSSKGKFRPDIEGLRAIAVLLVIAFHSGWSAFRGGFIGVDVFFVLSGYLITGLLIEEIGRNDRLNLVQFYSRRVRRLLPACALVVGVTALVSSRLLPPLDQASLGRTALATFLYASNLYFAHARNDYFASDSASNPLLHTWSLAVEEQFYIVWPILLLIAWRVSRSKRGIGWVIAATTALSFGGCVWLTKTNQALGFFLSPARAWEFGLGGLLTLLPRQSRFPAAFTRVVGWVGLGIILLSGMTFTSSMQFPGWLALVPVLGTAATLAAGRWYPEGGVARVLGLQPFQFFGNTSYSLYLWHWPILVLTAAAVPHFSAAVRICCVLASVGLAALTYLAFENPIRFSSFLIARPLANVASALLIGILGAALSSVWHHQVTRSRSYVQYASAMDDIPRLYRQACRTDFTDAVPKEYTFGDQSSTVAIVLYGDSHAAQWFPALERMAREHKWKLVTLVKSSCPAVAIASYNTFLQRRETECDQWRDRSLSRIEELHPAAVVVGTFSGYYQAEQPDHDITQEEWKAGAQQTFSRLNSAAAATVLIRDTPYPGFNVPKCLSSVAWTKRGECRAPRRSAALNDRVFEAEKSAAQQFQHVSVIDLSNSICGPNTCELVRGSEIIYRDQNHLTGTFIEKLTPVLEAEILPIISSTKTMTARLEFSSAGPARN